MLNLPVHIYYARNIFQLWYGERGAWGGGCHIPEHLPPYPIVQAAGVVYVNVIITSINVCTKIVWKKKNKIKLKHQPSRRVRSSLRLELSTFTALYRNLNCLEQKKKRAKKNKILKLLRYSESNYGR